MSIKTKTKATAVSASKTTAPTLSTELPASPDADLVMPAVRPDPDWAPDAREIVDIARDKAESMGDAEVGSAHLLFAFTKVSGLGTEILESEVLSMPSLAGHIEARMGGAQARPPVPEIQEGPVTSPEDEVDAMSTDELEVLLQAVEGELRRRSPEAAGEAEFFHAVRHGAVVVKDDIEESFRGLRMIAAAIIALADHTAGAAVVKQTPPDLRGDRAKMAVKVSGLGLGRRFRIDRPVSGGHYRLRIGKSTLASLPTPEEVVEAFGLHAARQHMMA